VTVTSPFDLPEMPLPWGEQAPKGLTSHSEYVFNYARRNLALRRPCARINCLATSCIGNVRMDGTSVRISVTLVGHSEQ
jgi:hypothetical protein